MDRPVDVVIAAHRVWHRSMGVRRSRCICRSIPNDAWASWVFVSCVGCHRRSSISKWASGSNIYLKNGLTLNRHGQQPHRTWRHQLLPVGSNRENKRPKMPSPTGFRHRISRERFKKGSRNSTALFGTTVPTNTPDMISIAAYSWLQNAIKRCTKKRVSNGSSLLRIE